MSASKLRVLVTGAAGRVGRSLCKGFRERYELRTLDRRPVPDDPDALIGDIRDLDFMKRALAGVEVLVHLAAEPYPFAEWTKDLVQPNIVGAQRTFQAAQEAGVRRIVYASSCHTVLGYPWDKTVGVNAMPCPATIYGVSKHFGEVLGRYYHDRHKLEFIAIRIGAFVPTDSPAIRKPGECRRLWLSPRDGAAIFQAALEKPGIGYAIVFGTSITDFEFLSLREAREVLGYVPMDDVTKL